MRLVLRQAQHDAEFTFESYGYVALSLSKGESSTSFVLRQAQHDVVDASTVRVALTVALSLSKGGSANFLVLRNPQYDGRVRTPATRSRLKPFASRGHSEAHGRVRARPLLRPLTCPRGGRAWRRHHHAIRSRTHMLA